MYMTEKKTFIIFFSMTGEKHELKLFSLKLLQAEQALIGNK